MPQIRAYEHANGAHGRRINYRAPRYAARELFETPFPIAVVAGAPFTLCDISRTGVSAIGAAAVDLSEGQTVPVQLRLGESMLHGGTAAITRVEPTDIGPKIGLKFVEAQVDLDGVVRRYRQELLRAHLARSMADLEKPPSDGFRLLVSDILNALRSCREVLEPRRIDRDFMPDGTIVEECLEALAARLGPLGEQANLRLESILEDPSELARCKKLVERILTPELTASPLWARAYDKPLNYPGDYLLIDRLGQGGADEGSPYVRLLERLARRAFAWAVRRTDLIADALVREMHQQRGLPMLHIASVGGGAAAEIVELIDRLRQARPIRLTLTDTDVSALDHAHTRLNEEVLRAGNRLSIACLNASYTEFMEGGELEGALLGQHIIVAPTLLDYLRHRAASQLLDALYASLEPGGLIIASCLRSHPGSTRWMSELVCDWSMIHRERDEVLALASGLAKAKVDVRLDRDRDLYLLTVRKPRALAAA